MDIVIFKIKNPLDHFKIVLLVFFSNVKSGATCQGPLLYKIHNFFHMKLDEQNLYESYKTQHNSQH